LLEKNALAYLTSKNENNFKQVVVVGIVGGVGSGGGVGSNILAETGVDVTIQFFSIVTDDEAK
jgi:hypothetical protein